MYAPKIDWSEYTYAGSGDLLLRRRDLAGGLQTLGDCESVAFGLEVESISTPNHRGGGGELNEFSRIKAVHVKATVKEYSPAAFALATYATVRDVDGGTVTGEPVRVYRGGGLARTEYPGPFDVEVSQGATPVTEGFEVRPSGLFVPADSPLWSGVDPAVEYLDLSLNYAYATHRVFDALKHLGHLYELEFEGLNEAKGEAPFLVRAWQVKWSVAQEIPLLSEKHASLQLEGSVRPDLTKPKSGPTSRFFQAIQLPQPT